ncbi:hypothetical protein [Aestuariibacter salexigens]|uniref:hypothetical protein n=1 Tax=Aestuariibacter salexigens TaxID=226010 RepID=UPI000403AB7A|nr:hypothetical protein [Aestuariibacter salexigens]
MIEIITTVIVIAIVIIALKPRSDNTKDSVPQAKQHSQKNHQPVAAPANIGCKHLEIDLECDSSRNTKKVESKFAWLQARWKTVFEQRDSGMESELVDDWYFDSPTEHQINRLKEDGVIVKRGDLTKGQYSDLIGILAQPEEETLAIIKFFGGSIKGLSDSEAGAQVRMLFANEENRTAWKNRPATARQKQFLKAMGEKVPRGLTHLSAEQLQYDCYHKYYDSYDDYVENLEDKEQAIPLAQWELKHKALTDWEHYEEIQDEFADPDFRDTYDIKKVPIGQLNTAIEQLKDKGITLSEMADDLDLVTAQCINNNPSLERQ